MTRGAHIHDPAPMAPRPVGARAIVPVGAGFLLPPLANGGRGTPHADAEYACAYVIEKVRASSGHLFQQGARVPPLACASASPAVRFIAERRLHRVPDPVARALLVWACGFPVELLTQVPSAEAVLALQAEGRRCVSLLPEGADTRPHADALAFTLHDLCHLDKLIDADHYRGQVGFFTCFHRAVAMGAWSEFASQFDAAFCRDWQHVAADMNGCAVFLFAALKMKLKMAARRRLGADKEGQGESGGPLTPSEARIYGRHLEEMIALLGLDHEVAAAARRTSARRDDPAAARTLLEYFEQIGDGVLRDRAAADRPSS